MTTTAPPRVDFDELVREQRFEMLVRDHQQRITRRVYAFCGNWTDAEEAVQDALVRMWADRARMDGVRDLAGWLYSVARYSVLDLWKARAKYCPALLGEHVERVEDQRPEPTGGPCMADPETAERVRQALTTLTPRNRQVAELHCIEGLSIGEVAARTGRTRQAVSQALYEVLRIHKGWDGPAWREQFANDPEVVALRTSVAVLAKLPPRVREVAWLRYVEGLPLAKTAARMKITVSHAENLSSKARGIARAELAAAGN